MTINNNIIADEWKLILSKAKDVCAQLTDEDIQKAEKQPRMRFKYFGINITPLKNVEHHDFLKPITTKQLYAIKEK